VRIEQHERLLAFIDREVAICPSLDQPALADVLADDAIAFAHAAGIHSVIEADLQASRRPVRVRERGLEWISGISAERSREDP
jgi:hypothetical protein